MLGMDSTAQTATPASEIITESASMGDAWIRQRKQPMWAMKSSTKTESRENQKSSTKLLPRVTRGFESAKTHVGFEIINKN
jgi:hypothetical protein